MQAGSSAAMASPVVMSRFTTAATAAPVTAGDDSALLDLLASDLTFTLDRKTETEQEIRGSKTTGLSGCSTEHLALLPKLGRCAASSNTWTLMEDLLASLRKEKDNLEEDAWRYAAKRSQPNLNT